jgi:hypothetical protein
MSILPASKYVELRDDGKVCIAGTRIGLDVLIYDFRRGETRVRSNHLRSGAPAGNRILFAGTG